MKLSLYFSVKFSDFVVTPTIRFSYEDGTGSETELVKQPFIIPTKIEKVSNQTVFTSKGMRCDFAIPHQISKIEKINIDIELRTAKFKGYIYIKDVSWDEAHKQIHYPAFHAIMRFMTNEEQKEHFD